MYCFKCVPFPVLVILLGRGGTHLLLLKIFQIKGVGWGREEPVPAQQTAADGKSHATAMLLGMSLLSVVHLSGSLPNFTTAPRGHCKLQAGTLHINKATIHICLLKATKK